MKNNQGKIFGYHLAMDLFNCDPKASRDMKKCYQYLDTMPDKMKIHKQSPPFIFYKDGIGKAGLCGWIPIVESGLSLYSFFCNNFMSVDVYSCKKFSIDKVVKITAETFKPREIKKQFILRGEKYFHPANFFKKIRG